MFATYSVSMTIFSPLIGKYQYSFGRRNMIMCGLIIASFAFLGFYLINHLQNFVFFIIVFVAMRIIQGLGTAMIRTSGYSILTLSYPKRVVFIVGIMETSTGIGLVIGPLLGTLLFDFGGPPVPFLTFFALLFLYGLFIKCLLPRSADLVQKSQSHPGRKITYCQLLLNKRILFSSLTIVLGIIQYTFTDPILGEYMHHAFGVDIEVSGYFFLSLAGGYMISAVLSPFAISRLSKMRVAV